MKIDAEQLIILVGQRPAMYNYTLKEHHNKELVEKLWEEVATEIGAVSSADCKAKWNILRSSYTRYVREMKKLRGLSDSSAAQRKKKWYLADQMSFLENFIGTHRPIRSTPGTQECTGDDAEFELKEESISEDEVILPDDTSDRPHSPQGLHVARRKRKLTPGDVISFLDPESRPTGLVNANMTFFESLLPDLEKLSARRQRQFKLQVHSLLNSYLDDQENEQASNMVSPASSHSPYNPQDK